jgi:hypothetical protein
MKTDDPATITEPLRTTPTIHSNGTSAKSLKDALEAAYDAANKARDMLRECRPNGRDYYLPYGSTLRDAERQANYRECLVAFLMDSIEGEMERIDDQTRR